MKAKTKIAEEELCDVMEDDLRQKQLLFYKEVPLISKRIDYLCVDQNERELIAIEMKVKNWKRALQQALTYRLGVDKVYIALWHEYVHRVDMNVLDDYGIGILEVNCRVEVKQEAKPSQVVQSSINKALWCYIQEQNRWGAYQ